MNNALRKARTEKGYSQSALARLVKAGRSTINGYELYGTPPRREYAERIANALGVTVEEIFPRLANRAGIPSKRIPADGYCNYRLRHAREEKPITAEALATQIGINPSTYLAYEALRICPPAETQEKIAAGLGKAVSELFPANLREITAEVERERKLRKEQNADSALDEKLTSPDEILNHDYGIYANDPRLLRETTFVQNLEENLRFQLQHPVEMHTPESVRKITTRERQYLDMFFGLSGNPYPIQEIIKRLKVSRQAVYIGIDKAIEKLRAGMELQVSSL